MAFCFKLDDSYMRQSLLVKVEHLLLENILNFAFMLLALTKETLVSAENSRTKKLTPKTCINLLLPWEITRLGKTVL
jgi:hypothetical protein